MNDPINTGSLKVTVQDASGNALVDSNVNAIITGSVGSGTTVSTGDNSNEVTLSLAIGSYTVTASKTGYNSSDQSGQVVKAGKTTIVPTFQLTSSDN